MRLRTVAMTGVLALSGLGLIGVGAHAVFTTTTASSQTINAGTPAVVTWAINATNSPSCTTKAQAIANDCTSITLTPGTVGSSFDEASAIGVYNNGNIAVSLTSFGVSDSDGVTTGANLSLQQNLGLCVNGVYNGLLHSYPNFNTGTNPATPIALGIGSTATYYIDLYAGGTSTNCGGSEPALPSGASGGSDTVTITVGYTG